METPVEGLIDITLTIEADVKKTAHDFTIGEMDLKVGTVANVKGKGYAASGYITVIER